MKPLLVAALLVLALSTGCQTTHVAPVSSVPSAKIEGSATIYVATPEDGTFNGKPYTGSGSTVASAFDAGLSRYVNGVVVGESRGATDEVVALARSKNCGYVLIPKITRWEDRATEWSGIRDKMNLFVKVIRVSDGTVIASAEITGKSGWMTFGGDHPQDLLREPIQSFVATLF